MTGEHPSGTDRIAEVVRRCCRDAQIIVNIQGDEPEIDPSHIDLVGEDAEPIIRRAKCRHSQRRSPAAANSTTIRATRWSARTTAVRSISADRPFPIVRDAVWDELLQTNSPWLLHLGLYAYRVEFLLKLSKFPRRGWKGWKSSSNCACLKWGRTSKSRWSNNARLASTRRRIMLALSSGCGCDGGSLVRRKTRQPRLWLCLCQFSFPSRGVRVKGQAWRLAN